MRSRQSGAVAGASGEPRRRCTCLRLCECQWWLWRKAPPRPDSPSSEYSKASTSSRISSYREAWSHAPPSSSSWSGAGAGASSSLDLVAPPAPGSALMPAVGGGAGCWATTGPSEGWAAMVLSPACTRCQPVLQVES
ncbi:NAD-dependent histone deacetylase SIR2 [Alternaria alternata]|nr:NAD-dependent histone deacetylase SIR2 [Alternaria alternata]